MRWISRDKKIDIALPDLVSPGVWTAFELGKTPWQLCWEPNLRTLFVRPGPGLPEIPLKYRTTVSRRFPGEMFTEIFMEYIGGPNPLAQNLHHEFAIQVPGLEGRTQSSGSQSEQIRSPMVGKILRILVEPGQSVERGSELLVIEAMKMENKIYVRNSGRIAEIQVNIGEQVSVGQVLARIEAS